MVGVVRLAPLGGLRLQTQTATVTPSPSLRPGPLGWATNLNPHWAGLGWAELGGVGRARARPGRAGPGCCGLGEVALCFDLDKVHPAMGLKQSKAN